MKIIVIILPVLMLLLSGCSRERTATRADEVVQETALIQRSQVTGQWIQPVPGEPQLYRGFVLYADGSAAPFHITDVGYEGWVLDENRLFFTLMAPADDGVVMETRTIIALTDSFMILQSVLDQSIDTFWREERVNWTSLLTAFHWRLVSINNQPFVDGSEFFPFVRFIPGTQKVEGFSGCNTFFGNYRTIANELYVDALGVTRKYCPGEMEVEEQFLAILQNANLFMIRDGLLTIYNEDNENLVFVDVRE